MKARTKAQRRGRPRKSGMREPNGRLQRDPLAESIAATRAANVQARMQMHGLSLVQAGEVFAGYEIGRMYLRGQITKSDVDIIDDYVKVVARYMSLASPGHPFPRAMDYLAARGQGGEPPADDIASIRRTYERWLWPIGSKDCRDDPAVVPHLMVFHNTAFFDKPCGHLVFSIKVCAASLKREFGRDVKENDLWLRDNGIRLSDRKFEPLIRDSSK